MNLTDRSGIALAQKLNQMEQSRRVQDPFAPRIWHVALCDLQWSENDQKIYDGKHDRKWKRVNDHRQRYNTAQKYLMDNDVDHVVILEKDDTKHINLEAVIQSQDVKPLEKTDEEEQKTKRPPHITPLYLKKPCALTVRGGRDVAVTGSFTALTIDTKKSAALENVQIPQVRRDLTTPALTVSAQNVLMNRVSVKSLAVPHVEELTIQNATELPDRITQTDQLKRFDATKGVLEASKSALTHGDLLIAPPRGVNNLRMVYNLTNGRYLRHDAQPLLPFGVVEEVKLEPAPNEKERKKDLFQNLKDKISQPFKILKDNVYQRLEYVVSRFDEKIERPAEELRLMKQRSLSEQWDAQRRDITSITQYYHDIPKQTVEAFTKAVSSVLEKKKSAIQSGAARRPDIAA